LPTGRRSASAFRKRRQLMLRTMMTILAVVHLLFTGLTALVGSFADGATIPERVLVSLVHPAAAILLLVAVIGGGRASRGLRSFTLALLLIGIAGDIVVAALIGLDVLKGQWLLALLFALVPAVGVVYLTATDSRSA